MVELKVDQLAELFTFVKERAKTEGADMSALQSQFDEIAMKFLNMEPQPVDNIVEEKDLVDGPFGPDNAIINNFLNGLSNEYLTKLKLVSKTNEFIEHITRGMKSIGVELRAPAMTMFDEVMSIYWMSGNEIINFEIGEVITATRKVGDEIVGSFIKPTVQAIDIAELIELGLISYSYT